MQKKSFGICVSIHLTQGKKYRTIGVNCNHEGYSRMNCDSTNSIGHITVSPALAPEVFLIDPSLIDVDDAFTLTE